MPSDRDQAFAALSDPALAKEALAFLKRAAEAAPGNALVQFDYAGACDMLGREFEAAVYYERVRAIGIEKLPKDEQPNWYVQTGSTLRLLGRLSQSRAVLTEGMEKFPANKVIAAFAALTELAAKEPKSAALTLLEALLRDEDDASINRFRRALRAYTDEAARRKP